MRGYPGACCGDGDDGYVDECAGYHGIPGMKIPHRGNGFSNPICVTEFSPDPGRNSIKKFHTH